MPRKMTAAQFREVVWQAKLAVERTCRHLKAKDVDLAAAAKELKYAKRVVNASLGLLAKASLARDAKVNLDSDVTFDGAGFYYEDCHAKVRTRGARGRTPIG